MPFTICPDNGYPRLWRFVAPGVLPKGTLCTLDAEFNILTIDKEQFDTLQPVEQHMLLRTAASQISYAIAA